MDSITLSQSIHLLYTRRSSRHHRHHHRPRHPASHCSSSPAIQCGHRNSRSALGHSVRHPLPGLPSGASHYSVASAACASSGCSSIATSPSTMSTPLRALLATQSLSIRPQSLFMAHRSQLVAWRVCQSTTSPVRSGMIQLKFMIIPVLLSHSWHGTRRRKCNFIIISISIPLLSDHV